MKKLIAAIAAVVIAAGGLFNHLAAEKLCVDSLDTTLYVTTPTTNVDGSPLDDLAHIVVMADGQQIGSLATTQTGVKVAVPVVFPSQGRFIVIALAGDECGSWSDESEAFSVRVKLTRPNPPGKPSAE